MLVAVEAVALSVVAVAVVPVGQLCLKYNATVLQLA